MSHKDVTRFLVGLLVFGISARSQIITPVAGTDWSFPAPSPPALNAPLAPGGIAIDPNGNVYVADGGNNMVMRIAPNGTLTVVAGNGIAGFSGEGGQATSAALHSPSAVTLDSSGNIYIADNFNGRIRKVSNGIITTVAGAVAGGNAGPLGDGGPAILANIDSPDTVAVDSAGALYIADENDCRVRKVLNGIITTVAGTGAPGYTGDGGPATKATLNHPVGVAVDAAGNLYISDSQNHVIRKVSNGTITTVAGNGTFGETGDNGPATNATFKDPGPLYLDAAGNLYIADYLGSVVRKVSGGTITTVAGDGAFAFTADGASAISPLAGVAGVTVDSTGALYFSESSSGRIRKVIAGKLSTIAGNGNFRYSGDGGPSTSAALSAVSAVAVDTTNNIYIVDSNRIRKVSNGIISTVAGGGNFGYSGDGGAATSAKLFGPTGLAVDLTGALYIADTQNHVVRKVANGIITTIAGTGSVGCTGDGGSPTSATFGGPFDVAVDSEGDVYIADPSCKSVRKISGGRITTAAGNSALRSPTGVAVGPGGSLYIADNGSNVIRMLSPSGALTTVAGNGKNGFPSGDGGPATAATLDSAF